MAFIANYGEWVSPITVQQVSEGSKRLGQIEVDGSDFYWLESKPDQKGRVALMKNGTDLLPDENVRTTYQEYGGGSFGVSEGCVIFCRFSDQNLYLYEAGKVRPITQETNRRFSEPHLDRKRGIVFALCEIHGDEVINQIVTIDLKSGKITPIATGSDFYGSLAISPNRDELAYIRWSHPHMPWDSTELMLAKLGPKGEITSEKLIAGNDHISIALPQFGPDGTLYYISDESGFWNYYTLDGPLFLEQVEYGEPLWTLGSSRAAFRDDQLYAIGTEKGEDFIALLDRGSKRLNLPFTVIRNLRALGDTLIFIGASPEKSPAIYRYNIVTGELSLLQESQKASLDPSFLSLPERLAFPSLGGATAYALYYPPRNPNYAAPQGSRPPLIVRCHGGPSGHVSPTFSWEILFWTSRGFGCVDVNYGGSTGYGRVYRERLNGMWGVVDVADCVAAAEFLINAGEADPSRLYIRGGSAGGYTVLQTIAHTNLFRAATSLFGVADLQALDLNTHKFESHYNFTLVGPPGKEALYIERSPVHNADKMHTPVLFLQGLDDKIVPPEHSEDMAKALREKGVPVEIILFEGESHGFRKAESIQRALNAELEFYNQFSH